MKDPVKKLNARIHNYVDALSDEQRQKATTYLYASLTLFTVCFFGIFAITPTLTTISNLNKQYTDNKLIYDSLQRKLSNLQRLDTQYETIRPDLPRIYDAIPRTTKIPQLTRQIEEIAATSGVNIKDLSFGTIEIYPNTKSDDIYSFTFTVSVGGTDDAVNTFLANVINFDRIVGIDKVTTGKDELGQTNAQITGRAYFSSK